MEGEYGGITVDDREGSGKLAPLLAGRGLPVSLGRIPFGDISFVGSGMGGEPVTVGVEVKTVRDVLQCITNGRFAGYQLPGLVQSYQQVYLLIVGEVKACIGNGLLQVRGHGGWQDATVGSRRFMYKDLHTWLLTIQIKGGIGIVTCSNYNEAILWLSGLWGWWTVKGWEEHKAHLALNTTMESQLRDRALLIQPSLVRRVAAQLPGVGFDKSGKIAERYGTVEELMGRLSG